MARIPAKKSSNSMVALIDLVHDAIGRPDGPEEQRIFNTEIVKVMIAEMAGRTDFPVEKSATSIIKQIQALRLGNNTLSNDPDNRGNISISPQRLEAKRAQITEEAMSQKQSNSKNSTEDRKQIIVHIQRSGDRVQVPEGMILDDAIDALVYQRDREEQVQAFNGPIERAMVLDAAHAFSVVLDRKFGYVQNMRTPNFWGSDPPKMMKVSTGYGRVTEVPWGRMGLPGISGYLETGVRELPSGRFEFVIQGEVRQKHMTLINEIIEETKQYVRDHSIYKGTSFRLRMTDDRGKAIQMPEPAFMDLSKVKPHEMVYSEDVTEQIETSIFAPIQYSDACRAANIPLKRGVLLCGPYGTGKTLCATVTAKLAIENDWTFILCEKVNDLKEILDMALEYGPAVVFCEDIDQALQGERSVGMNDILNTIDGVTAKNGAEVMTILTTNHVELINQAMLRPGRLDAIIEVRPPDAEAVTRLIRLYAGNLLPEDTDIAEVGESLAGSIPAVIREVVERSKLSALAVNKGASQTMTVKSLLTAARSMQLQLHLLKEKSPDTRTPIEKAADTLAGAIRETGGTNEEQVAAAAHITALTPAVTSAASV